MAAMLKGSSMSLATRSRSSVRTRATPANVAEARDWINAWKSKTEARQNRPSWFPGSKLPDHLDGSLPADFGFDPLSLGVDAGKLKWYVQAELVHARFAMLGAAGILVPDLFHAIGAGGPAAQIPWFDHAKFTYYADAHALFGVQMLLFFFVEMRRYQDYLKPGSSNQDPFFANNKLPAGNTPGYPGGIFDPLGYSKGDFATLKVKELKNGRLAMLAMAGFFAQAYTTGKTPLTNLSEHLASPWTTTVFSNDLARL